MSVFRASPVGSKKISLWTPQSDSFYSVAITVHRFPLVRLEMKCEMFNRHNIGKIMTIKQTTSSNSILDHTTLARGLCPGQAVPSHLPTLSTHSQGQIQERWCNSRPQG